MVMAKVKQTTGIVGLEVVPKAREVLISPYTMTLKEIQAVPEDEGYRKAVESFTPTASAFARKKGIGSRSRSASAADKWRSSSKKLRMSSSSSQRSSEKEWEFTLHVNLFLNCRVGSLGCSRRLRNVRSLKTMRQSPNTFLRSSISCSKQSLQNQILRMNLPLNSRSKVFGFNKRLRLIVTATLKL